LTALEIGIAVVDSGVDTGHVAFLDKTSKNAWFSAATLPVRTASMIRTVTGPTSPLSRRVTAEYQMARIRASL